LPVIMTMYFIAEFCLLEMTTNGWHRIRRTPPHMPSPVTSQ
jgi:hypothetical protein